MSERIVVLTRFGDLPPGMIFLEGTEHIRCSACEEDCVAAPATASIMREIRDALIVCAACYPKLAWKPRKSPSETDRVLGLLDHEATSAVNVSVKRQAQTLLGRLRAILSARDLRDAPILRGSILDDDSLLVEWIWKETRLVFNVEAEETESGWHYISLDKPSDNVDFGSLRSADLSSLVDRTLRKHVR